MRITFLFQKISLLYFQHLFIAHASKHLQMSVKFNMNYTFYSLKKSPASHKKTFYIRNESKPSLSLKKILFNKETNNSKDIQSGRA